MNNECYIINNKSHNTDISLSSLITWEIGNITCNVITTSHHQEVPAHVTCDKRIYNEGGDTLLLKTDEHPQVLSVSEIENERMKSS